MILTTVFEFCNSRFRSHERLAPLPISPDCTRDEDSHKSPPIPVSTVNRRHVGHRLSPTYLEGMVGHLHTTIVGASDYAEESEDVISSAADRQRSHLRTFQTGRHSEQSQKLLNKGTTAQVRLLKPELRRSEDSQLVAGVFGHAVRRPGRGHHDLDFHVGHVGQRALDRFRLLNELRAGGAGGAGHGHVDLDVRLVFELFDFDAIHQAKIDDVDKQLGINDLLERFADVIFSGGHGKTISRISGLNC